MIEISKELLSEVLDEYIDAVKLNGNEIVYAFRVSSCSMTPHGYMHDEGSINIYELCHIMKEWIINKGYVLRICYVLENDTRDLAFVEATLYKSNQYSSDYYDMDSKTEIEAVIKACEWILKEIKR